MTRQYFTQPFNPAVAEKQAGGDRIARLMGDAVNQAAQQGWTFQSYETVQITVNPGCLTFMAGSRTAHYGVLVFFRDV